MRTAVTGVDTYLLVESIPLHRLQEILGVRQVVWGLWDRWSCRVIFGIFDPGIVRVLERGSGGGMPGR